MELPVGNPLPCELGGAAGGGTNPEQLFAAGYSPCFLGAMKFVGARDGIRVPVHASVRGTVGTGVIESGFGIEADLEITLPGFERGLAQSLVERAQLVCPYSNTTRDNVDGRLHLL